jgi:RimJ/RimL family protein N-acetyltransferase
MPGLVSMRTKRLLLSSWTEADWLLLKPIATDPEVMRYISEGQIWPDDRIQEFVQRQITCLHERDYCMWKLTEPDTGQMIGFCGLQPLPNADEIEIGWWLARSHWGRGLATEAARAALRDGFERVGLERIVAVAHPDNRASRHVMEKLGMRYERDTEHKSIGVVLYAVHASEPPMYSGT